MKKSSWLPAVFIFVLAAGPCSHYAQEKIISWEKAGNYVGREVVVEGAIVRTFNSGRACFLNFHPDYQRYLSLVIFASDFNGFPPEPEKYYLNKKVRARGRVLLYRARPEIILNSPAQITIIGELAGSQEPGLEAVPEMRPPFLSEPGPRHLEKYPGKRRPLIMGQTVWVRGTVVAASNTGQACFLNFHRNWKRYFTAVIFARDFDHFPEPPEKLYLRREIRVFGRVREYQANRKS